MNAKRLIIPAIVLILIGFGAYQSFQEEKIVDYNDATIDLLSQSDDSFNGFIPRFGQWFEGETIDVVALSGEVDVCLETNKNILTSIEVQEHSSEATVEAFHQQVIAYMASNVRIVEKYKEAVAYVKDHNPGDEASWDYVDQMVTPMIEENSALFDAVVIAQEAMAAKHDFTLE